MGNFEVNIVKFILLKLLFTKKLLNKELESSNTLLSIRLLRFLTTHSFDMGNTELNQSLNKKGLILVMKWIKILVQITYLILMCRFMNRCIKVMIEFKLR